MASAFGARLRRLREAKKLTLQQVADAVGCTKAYIWELEMKDGQRPSAERIQAIAKVLGVTMEDVMGESYCKAGSPSQPWRTWPSSASTRG
jgi:transcriptional regulator with XRE-family HTH domain